MPNAPFLHMRTSERRAMRTCPQKWWWGTVEGLQPKQTPTPLWLGTGVHDALATWYQPGLKRKGPLVGNFLKSVEEMKDVSAPIRNEEDELEYISAKDLGVEMLTHYQETYGKDSKWSVIATEQPFQVDLPRLGNTFKLGRPVVSKKPWLRYVGQIDGVYRDLETGEIWLMEHKTAAAIVTTHLPLDDQAGSYWAFATLILRKAGLLKDSEEIAGIMYNFLRKAPRDTRPRNADGLYTNLPKKDDYIAAIQQGATQLAESLTGKETLAQLVELAGGANLEVLGPPSASQPPAFFERHPVYRSRGERKTMIERIQNEARFKESYLRGTIPVLKNPGRECGFCQFNTICQMDEAGDHESVEEMKQLKFTVKDPYSIHRDKDKDQARGKTA